MMFFKIEWVKAFTARNAVASPEDYMEDSNLQIGDRYVFKQKKKKRRKKIEKKKIAFFYLFLSFEFV